MSNIYGYVRVSTKVQNEDRQMIAMREMGVPEKNIYMDKQSGKDFERPQYRRLVRHMKRDDLLYIKSIKAFRPRRSGCPHTQYPSLTGHRNNIMN